MLNHNNEINVMRSTSVTGPDEPSRGRASSMFNHNHNMMRSTSLPRPDEPVGEYTSHHTTQGASQPSRYYIIPRNALFLIKAVHPYEL